MIPKKVRIHELDGVHPCGICGGGATNCGFPGFFEGSKTACCRKAEDVQFGECFAVTPSWEVVGLRSTLDPSSKRKAAAPVLCRMEVLPVTRSSCHLVPWATVAILTEAFSDLVVLSLQPPTS